MTNRVLSVLLVGLVVAALASALPARAETGQGEKGEAMEHEQEAMMEKMEQKDMKLEKKVDEEGMVKEVKFEKTTEMDKMTTEVKAEVNHEDGQADVKVEKKVESGDMANEMKVDLEAEHNPDGTVTVTGEKEVTKDNETTVKEVSFTGTHAQVMAKIHEMLMKLGIMKEELAKLKAM